MSTDDGTLTEPQARRVRWLVPLVLTLAAAAAWAAAPFYEKPSPPPKPGVVLGDSDGLPRELVSGETYMATLSVTFPADWKYNGSVLVTGRAVPDEFQFELDDVILCSMGWAEPAGQTVTFSCSIETPSPGPYNLTAGGWFGEPAKVYHHIVVPSSRPGSPPP